MPKSDALFEEIILRERRARNQAEDLLEEKSRTLYLINQKLEDINATLETVVAQKTQKIQESLERAKRANQEKTDFIANISHDLRTPLNTILGLSSLLLEESLDERVYDYVNTIHGAGIGLLNLVNQILDLAQIEAHCFSLKKACINFPDLVESCVNLHAPLAQQKGLSLVATANIGAKAVYVEGDSARITQVINNLITNSVKYTMAGGVTVNVCYTLHATTCEITVSVEDTGIGIQNALSRDIFDRFYSLDRAESAHHESRGLGLAICKNLIEQMDGELGFESEPDVGSRFWFCVTLPRREPTQQTFVPSTGSLSGTVLIVDDSATNLKVIGLMLQKSGCTILKAEGAEKAIAILKDTAVDVVLMDIQMPGLDGLEAAGLIKGDPQCGQPIIIAMTANAFYTDQIKCRRAGMDDYISKPIHRPALLQLLAQYLNDPSEE